MKEWPAYVVGVVAVLPFLGTEQRQRSASLDTQQRGQTTTPPRCWAVATGRVGGGWRWSLARKKHSAKRGVRIRKGELRPSDAIRRGEIVEEIVLNLRPRKDRISETTVTAEVNRELDILLGHVPAQARWSNRTRNRAHAQKLDGALREVEKLTRLASTPGYLAFLLFSPPSGPPPSIVDIEHASQIFAAELKRMRNVCALAVDPRFGSHPNYDHAKHLSARSAHGLMQGIVGEKNHWDGGWQIPYHRQPAL